MVTAGLTTEFGSSLSFEIYFDCDILFSLAKHVTKMKKKRVTLIQMIILLRYVLSKVCKRVAPRVQLHEKRKTKNETCTINYLTTLRGVRQLLLYSHI